MAFWSAVGPEPLRQHRWYMVFGGGSLDNISYALKKVDKPKAKIGSVQHKYLNHYFNYPGRLEWEDINLTFASVTSPSPAANVLWTILQGAGYGVPNSFSSGNQISSIGKNKFGGAIGPSVVLNQVSAEGITIETWEIYRPFFTSVQFGSLDYSNEDIVEVSCTVKYDWAQLKGAISSTENAQGTNPGFPSR